MQNRNLINAVTAFVLFIFSAVPISYSIPVPHGVDGTILELDGITKVPAGTDFYVKNNNNGNTVYGTTDSNGAYSVSLNGDDGNTIVVRAWNKYNQVNATLTLAGVMRNVNLYLNMTYPPIAPVITSTPEYNAIEDTQYSYQVSAYDENNDLLQFSFSENPIGMSIDSQSGLIAWIPRNSNVGLNDVSVLVSDGIFYINQSFTLNVQNVNDAPTIISVPVETGAQDSYYFYDADAADDDNDQLVYTLIQNPIGMSINASTGLIEWTPSAGQVGISNTAVEATDGNLEATQKFSIDVSNVNDLPVIISLPVTAATQDVLYSYDVDSTDIDNDVLQFSVLEGPAGMSIDSASGVVSWTPGNDDVGIQNVAISVSDGTGTTSLPYTITVENVNDAPIIDSVPQNEPVSTGGIYIYDADASDIDNDVLQYSLKKFPEGMAIDSSTGIIKWVPSENQAGEQMVAVEASDGILSAEQDFSVYVKAPEQTPKNDNKGKGKLKHFIKKLEGNNRKTEIAIESPTDNVELNIEELSEKPKDASGLQNRVYKYLKIDKIQLENSKPSGEEFEVNFTVDREWIKEIGIDESAVVLNRYHNKKWSELETSSSGNYGNFAKYSATTPGFSYFAISVRQDVPVKTTITPQISRIEAPYSISGIVYKFGGLKQAESGTGIAVRNLRTMEVFIGETNGEGVTGAYSMLINGEAGDIIEIMIQGTNGAYKTELKDQRDIDFMLNIFGNGFSRVKFDLLYTSIAQPYTLLIAAVLASSFIALRKAKKSINRKSEYKKKRI
ncbi:MAG TPA: putative Ig domain-containing protein [Candidatus Nanoarchaeia archaeon]|nr:putative Ig domain-containing protein [Candidatus Nanoarchaeia archaeon]